MANYHLECPKCELALSQSIESDDERLTKNLKLVDCWMCGNPLFKSDITGADYGYAESKKRGKK